MRASACFVYVIVIFSLYNYFYKTSNSHLVLTEQQHHPVAPIPAGVEDDLPNGKVRVTDRLTGMLPAIASILVWS